MKFFTIFLLCLSFSIFSNDQVISSFIKHKIVDCRYVLCHNPSYEEELIISGQICAYNEILNFLDKYKEPSQD